MKDSLLKKAAEPFRDLFWKTQVRVMRTFPSFSGFISKHGMGAQNSRGVWVKTLGMALLQVPRFCLTDYRDRRNGQVILPRVSFLTTLRCTLNCDKCVALIPDLTIPRDMKLEAVIADLEKLFLCVDKIQISIGKR